MSTISVVTGQDALFLACAVPWAVTEAFPWCCNYSKCALSQPPPELSRDRKLFPYHKVGIVPAAANTDMFN